MPTGAFPRRGGRQYTTASRRTTAIVAELDWRPSGRGGNIYGVWRAATKFSGVTVQYDPDASLAECRQGARRMREHWDKDKHKASNT